MSNELNLVKLMFKSLFIFIILTYNCTRREYNINNDYVYGKQSLNISTALYYFNEELG